MNFKELVAKKVFGIPVLYLAAAAVTIFAVVAWKMKPTASEETSEDAGVTEGVADAVNEADYSGLASGGTVTVTPATPTQEEVDKETNDDWERAAVAHLVEAKLATAGEAQAAINKYLEGADLTYDQGRLRDAALAKLGLPPEKMTAVGSVGAQPAQKQFTNFPGTHTVKGTADNTPAKLAQLYYGNGDTSHTLKVVSKNAILGPNGTTYGTGTKVNIPAWENPRYFTITKTTQWPSQVASKNGMSVNGFTYLNPGLVAPYKIGSKVRVG